MTTLYRRLRLRHGLRWARNYPSSRDMRDTIRTAILLLIIALAYAVVGTMDYADQQAMEAERQARAAEQATRMVADCMNGTLRFLHDNKTGRGYSKTAVVCMKAEEFDI